MPRTFSRGQKWTAESLIRQLKYISVPEFDFYARQMRLSFCIEPGLIEQDLGEFWNFMLNRHAAILDFLPTVFAEGVVGQNIALIDQQGRILRLRIQEELDRIGDIGQDIFV